MTIVEKIKAVHQEKFQVKPTCVVRAPGRINLLGEHTDYNGGFVLPAAIDKAIYFSISLRNDSKVNLYSVDLDQHSSQQLYEIKPCDQAWANFIYGVIDITQKKDCVIDKGFDLAFGGNIPLGAGLSSSAAVECGVATALKHLFDLNLSKKELALIAQKAEHKFAGVNCGIMDMYASIFGRKNQVISLDCREVSHKYYHFPFDDFSIVLFNTMVKHSLADSAYNKRRLSCEQGLSIIKSHFSQVKDLRDVSREQLNNLKSELDSEVLQRCTYVVGETYRMKEALNALEEADIDTFGRLMYETHNALSQEYEVSCEELDFLVDLVRNEASVAGSRMMGGGFGGCTINLIQKKKVKEISKMVQQQYYDQYDIEPEVYEVSISEGCSVLER